MNCGENNQNKECIPYEEYIKVVELARAYVPFQKLCSIYDANESMIKGTIFPELARGYCEKDKNLMREDKPCFENM
ncbi:spore coat associated protein CotJA [[Clostridium] colinum]|uniref:spore coat associated protein CotJA n=1 Tax=[Clostridium] colinum TaxID=36835 RepID=UPI002025B139|nr:spore coat associated protein CotJA [[Clostridium] colinum]